MAGFLVASGRGSRLEVGDTGRQTGFRLRAGSLRPDRKSRISNLLKFHE